MNMQPSTSGTNSVFPMDSLKTPRKKHGWNCFVPSCFNKGIHKLPLDREVRNKWIKVLRLPGRVKSRVKCYLCSDHFKPSDFYPQDGDTNNIRQLRNDAVPSLLPWIEKEKEFKFVADPSIRTYARFKPVTVYVEEPTDVTEEMVDETENFISEIEIQECDENDKNPFMANCEGEDIMLNDDEDMFNIDRNLDVKDCDISTSKIYNVSKNNSFGITSQEDESFQSCLTQNTPSEPVIKYETGNSITCDKAQQMDITTLVSEKCDASSQTEWCFTFSSYLLANNKDSVRYFTGFESYDKLQELFKTFENKLHQVKILSLQNRVINGWLVRVNKFEQFFITLMILHRSKSVKEVSMLYSLPHNCVNVIFFKWIKFLYSQWKCKFCNNAPVKYLLLFVNEKQCSVRVILDATKTDDGRKFDVKFRHDHIVGEKKKVLLGISIDGLINYVSPCYEESVSDVEVIRKSEPLPLLRITDQMRHNLNKSTSKICLKTLVSKLLRYSVFIRLTKYQKGFLTNDAIHVVCSMLVNLQNKSCS